MSNIPNNKYFENKNSETLSVLLNGANYLMDSPFMVKLFENEKKKGNSVLSFNFPFQDRGETHSSGEELPEETEALSRIVEKYANGKTSKIKLIAKSLGSIVAIKYLSQLPKEEQTKYSLYILGTPLRFMTKEDFISPIAVIQGSEDKNGGTSEVKKFFEYLSNDQVKYFEIKGADHSFCNPQNKEPLYEDEAISYLS